MTQPAKPFAFTQLVPGFDFLRSLAGSGSSGGAAPGLPGLSSWVAPTLSVEELDKRIRELKTVQFWLEQNVHALKATIQALEVQKMTLSTLRGMNVRMEDLANAFTRTTASAAAAMRDAAAAVATPAPAPEAAPPAEPPQAEEEEDEDIESPEDGEGEEAADTRGGKKKAGAATPAQGVVDTLQWWNALTQQFQQIASNALQDAAQLRMPGDAGAGAPARARKGRAATAKTQAGAKSTRGAKTAKTAAKKTPAPAASRVGAKSATTRKSGGR